MSRSSIARAFSAGLVVSVVTAGIGVVRAKVAAVILGPAGLGVTAEVLQLVTVATTLGMLAGGPALAAAVSRSVHPEATAADREAAQAAYDTAWTAVLLLGAAGVLIAALAAAIGWPWGGDGWWWVLALGAGAVLTQGATVTGRALSAAGKIRQFSAATLVALVLQAGAVIAGTWSAGLPGFFVGALLGPALAAPVWQALAARAAMPLRVLPRPRLERGALNEALRLGAAGLAGTAASQLALLTLRTSLSHGPGSTSGGLFQACWSIDAVILQSVLTTLGSFIFPRYAAARTLEALQAEVDGAASFVLRVAPPVLLFGIAVRGPILLALYSPEFRPAVALLGLILAGDMAKLLSWTQGGVLLYRGHARAFAVQQVVVWALFAGLAVLGVRSAGLIGVGWAYVATYAVNVGVTAYAVRRLGVSPSARGVGLALGGMLLGLASNAAMDRWTWGVAVPLVAAAVWAIGAGLPQLALRLPSALRAR